VVATTPRVVASIWSSSEASWITAAATLELSVMSTASIWYLLACSCAAADSTVRLVSPKTSGV
jgi:hypothetical protein